MAVKRGGLGKGLDSLIAPTANPKIKKHTEEKQDTVKVVAKGCCKKLWRSRRIFM